MLSSLENESHSLDQIKKSSNVKSSENQIELETEFWSRLLVG